MYIFLRFLRLYITIGGGDNMTGPDEKYILDNFENAIENGYIKPFFQPIIRTLTGSICAAETLARWDDPQYGLLSPALFVEVLEKHGLIKILDLAMTEMVCFAYDYLEKNGIPHIPFSINLSRIDFENGDIFEEIMEIFNKYNVPASAVHIEITESVTLDNTDSFPAIFDKFHNAGFEIWMDDFGSGYTSLNVLKDYDFDLLKIDMKFLSSISIRSRRIIAAIVNMAKSLGIHTLAEGIETAEQFEFLKSVGCEMVQGYYFAKPMDSTSFTTLFSDKIFELEPSEEYGYWNATGMLNVLSPDPFEYYNLNSLETESYKSQTESSFPIQFLELRNGKFYFPYVNEAYMKEERKLGIYDGQKREEIVNDRTKGYYHDTIKQVEAGAQTKGVLKKDYVLGDVFYSFITKFIAKTPSTIMTACTLKVFGDEGVEKRYEVLNKYSHALFYNFELINILRPEMDSAKQIYSSIGFNKIYGTVSLRRGIKEFAETEIYKEDKERYIEFMNMDNVNERIIKDGCSFVQQPFRFNDGAGSYSWRLVRLTRIPTLNDFNIMYSIQRMPPVDVDAIEKLIKEDPDMFKK